MVSFEKRSRENKILASDKLLKHKEETSGKLGKVF